MHFGQGRDAYGRFGTVPRPNASPSLSFSTQTLPLYQPGAPKKDFALAFEKVLLLKVTEEVWGDIFDTAISQAKKGDKDARKWLTDYFVGPPIQRASVDMQIRARTVVSEEIVTSRDFVDGVITSIMDVEEST